MAEDYAPFDVNVTTEPPATITNRTAIVLITRNTDANGAANPFNNSGGVAYVNVFGRSDFISRYSPAWVYHNNLSNNESFIAEAASHEIGHNLGLSHDGLTSGAEYYGGHGSGDISWGPIMGTGYNRNVSQWSKGDYYNANNTQDDLSTIAGKLAYRPDDHGNTPGSATALTISNGDQIFATDLGSDPENSNPANKGVIERTNDLDVFSFISGDGPVSINASPWVMPAGTRGGNLDILLEIRDEGGLLIASSNPADKTGATVETTLTEGRYFLHVRNTGTGDPIAPSPTGYTPYGSIGSYYLSGSITETVSFNPAPIAQLEIQNISAMGEGSHSFSVTYSDDSAINVATIGSGDIRVTGPNGFDQIAGFLSVDEPSNGSPRAASYAISPPDGSTWTAAANGTYGIFMEQDQVADNQGAFVPAGSIGTFEINVPTPIYSANMDNDPGWTLESGTGQNVGWEYGAPAYSGNTNAPTSAYTGNNIVGYILDGNYQRDIPSPRYATTSAIDVSAASNLTLQFRRWLRLTNQGFGSIEVSIDNSTWTPIWEGSAISDSSWQLVQYPLPSFVEGSSSLRIRWGISSGKRPQTDIGWHIDDVLVLGDGAVDAHPPEASLSVGNISQDGTPSHSCAVTFTDASAVRISSLDAFNLRVTGPNGYDSYAIDLDSGVETTTLAYIGADSSIDDSPITASYDIPAPDGQQWQAADNGTYTITLRGGTVEDILNNTVSEIILGDFEVVISEAAPGLLSVTPGTAWESGGDEGGPFSPTSITYTLGNSGETPLDWTASKTAPWFELSAESGSIEPGAAVEITAALSAQAEALEVGKYADIISFVNTSSGEGNTSRDVFLTISAGGQVTRFTGYGFSESGAFSMLVSGTPGQSVQIEWSENLADWEVLLNTEIGPEGQVTVEDPDSPDQEKRFYRVLFSD